VALVRGIYFALRLVAMVTALAVPLAAADTHAEAAHADARVVKLLELRVLAQAAVQRRSRIDSFERGNVSEREVLQVSSSIAKHRQAISGW